MVNEVGVLQAPTKGRAGCAECNRHLEKSGVKLGHNRAGFSRAIVMTIEQFRATLHQLLFRPFTIRMADGRSFDVSHRDFIAHSPSGRTVIIVQDDESYSVLDLLLMTEVEVHAANGRPA
jgi:hypothetical protein